MRTPIIAGNWKLNKTISESVELTTRLKDLVAKTNNVDIVVAPPFTAIDPVRKVNCIACTRCLLAKGRQWGIYR